MRRTVITLTALALSATVGLADTPRKAAPEQPSATWETLRPMVFADAALVNGEDVISLDAPYRAHDAATVPVEMVVTPPEGGTVSRLTLIVDENPAPVAAEFELFDGMGKTIEISTRIRVNAYSNVRVIAEMDDGTLFHVARFVKASGGCSAPATKDAAAALASLGKMKMRFFKPELQQSYARAEAQILIRHPNASGFQLDQVTQLFVPAHFVNEVEVTLGDEPLFRMEGGISLSEDPSFRFSYIPNGADEVAVTAVDTEGAEFSNAFRVSSGS